jgi:hypothetical protein
MKYTNLLFTAFIAGLPLVCAAAPKCSQTNMLRCLDSVCAINIGMNPAARCQYCGNSAAGTPPAQKGLKNVNVGQSSKYAIGDKELAVAPSDPGKRYIWATTECIKKVGNCTTDDVSAIYDKLIEQSCKAAGVNIQITKAVAKLDAKPSATKCKNTLTTCMEDKCGTKFENCATDSDIDRVASECATETTGCDEYVKGIKAEFALNSKNMQDKNEQQLQQIVQEHQTTRKNALTEITDGCKNGANEASCIKDYTNILGAQIAKLVCGYHKTACDTVSTDNNKLIDGATTSQQRTNEK